LTGSANQTAVPSLVLCGKSAREIPNAEPDPQPARFLLDLMHSLTIIYAHHKLSIR